MNHIDCEVGCELCWCDAINMIEMALEADNKDIIW